MIALSVDGGFQVLRFPVLWSVGSLE